MNVVALLSGGKDSCYTLLQARLRGNKVIAVAHITPPRDEADSFMYQSVGSAAVPYIAKALNLPLFTQPTHAQAKEQGIIYTPTADDEVEDLVTLLRKVKTAHPELQAVCAGALWSDYQRLRVESSAARVGLLSLAYLWRREQSDLLDEMIAAGVHAILIKVAGIGLNEKHLGKTLKEMRPTLKKLEEMYGSHVCGEGGEYESLVLWMPGFEKRVLLHETEVVLHADNPVAPVSYMRVGRCSVEDLLDEQRTTPLPSLRVDPAAFDFQPTDHKVSVFEDECHTVEKQLIDVSVGQSDSFLHIVVRSSEEGGDGVAGAALRLQKVLKELNETMGNVIYVILYLRAVSGDKYVAANAGYNKVFNVPECTPPPSRACVGMFPSNLPTTLEALVSRNRDKFDEDSFTLHVQSLSEWAPPCIGPYAQLVEEDGVLHVCGVLPLHAPTASILPGMPIRKQVEACVYNLGKTLEASRGGISDLGFFAVYVVDPDLVDEVESELERLIDHDRHISVILPVSGLPKDGLVEIRSVGVTDNKSLSQPTLSSDAEMTLDEADMECEVVVCGKLGFMVVSNMPIRNEQKSDHSDMITGAVLRHPFEKGSQPLSLQVYTTCNAQELTDQLKVSFADTAISVFSTKWLPKNASFTCIATFAMQSRADL